MNKINFTINEIGPKIENTFCKNNNNSICEINTDRNYQRKFSKIDNSKLDYNDNKKNIKDSIYPITIR
jgi:hypothetical protein